MTPPPTNIDGTDITGATIDGQDVQEITVDGQTVFSGIPDSAIFQFDPTDIGASDGQTVSTWPEAIAGADMSMTGNPTYQADVLSSSGDAVRGDGVDDHGQTSTMGSFGSDMDTNFAIAVGFSTTSTGRCATVNDSGTICGFGNDAIGGSSNGTFTVLFRDEGDNRISAETTSAVDDGGDHVFIINKTGNNAGDIAIYDSPTNDVSVAGVNESFTNPANFNFPFTYFAQNAFGSIGNYWNVDLGQIIWFNDSLTQSERSDVFGLYEWY